MVDLPKLGGTGFGMVVMGVLLIIFSNEFNIPLDYIGLIIMVIGFLLFLGAVISLMILTLKNNKEKGQ